MRNARAMRAKVLFMSLAGFKRWRAAFGECELRIAVWSSGL